MPCSAVAVQVVVPASVSAWLANSVPPDSVSAPLIPPALAWTGVKVPPLRTSASLMSTDAAVPPFATVIVGSAAPRSTQATSVFSGTRFGVQLADVSHAPLESVFHSIVQSAAAAVAGRLASVASAQASARPKSERASVRCESMA